MSAHIRASRIENEAPMRNLQRALVLGACGIVSAAGLATAQTVTSPPSDVLAACDMNIVPYDPYHQTCGIPNQVPTAPGQSPGAGAIIACRNIPGCLSQVVNGPQLVAVPRPDTRVRQSP